MIKEVWLFKSWQYGCFGCYAFGKLGRHLVLLSKRLMVSMSVKWLLLLSVLILLWLVTWSVLWFL
jgi:hypothetical protein